MRILQLKEGGGGVDDSQQDLFIAAHTHTHIHCAVSNRFFRVCRELLSTESPTHVTDFTLIAGIRVMLLLLIARSPNLRNVNVERYYRKLLL